MPADGSVSTLAGAPESVVLPVTRRERHPVLLFLIYASPFFLSGFGYEGLRRMVHLRGAIHVADLHALEARLFSIDTASGSRSLSDLISSVRNPLLDLVSGATYLLFMLEVFGIGAYLFFRARAKMPELSIAFLLMNLVGWTIWLLYPAAPPWYVDAYGLGPAHLDAVSSTAGLSRIDALLPFPVAATFYAKSANVFGAMPSLHVAYATLVALVVFPLRGTLRWATIAFAFSMAFSAVYLRHHYILDVIFGALLAPPFAVLGKHLAARLRLHAEGAL
jgi:membrane-associated phospholipid phosphatase